MPAELGIRVHLRDVVTLDDLCAVTVPAPVEPGDLVASAGEVYRVEVVLTPVAGASCEAVLARRVEPAIATC